MYIHMCTYAYVYMESCRCVWECTRGSVDSAEEPQRRLLAISFFTSMAGGAAGFTVKTPKCIYMHVCMYVNMYVLYVLSICMYVHMYLGPRKVVVNGRKGSPCHFKITKTYQKKKKESSDPLCMSCAYRGNGMGRIWQQVEGCCRIL